MSTDLTTLAAQLKKHPHDELIFGGYICTTCTPEDADDPDQNVAWPCQQLLDAGMTEPMAQGNLLGYQRAVDDIHRLKREEIAHITAERDGAKSELTIRRMELGVEKERARKRGEEVLQLRAKRDKALMELAGWEQGYVGIEFVENIRAIFAEPVQFEAARPEAQT